MCIEGGQILYEIVAKTKKDEYCVVVKRGFKEFTYLDKTLERKYGQLIREQGIFKKRA